MSMRTALHAELADDTTIAGLVGIRIRPGVAGKADALPYIVYNKITDVPAHHMTAAAGLTTTHWQIDCYAGSASAADTLAEAVRDALDGFPAGTMGSGDNTANVRGCRLHGTTDDYIPPAEGQEYGVYRRIMEFEIWHTQSVPTFA